MNLLNEFKAFLDEYKLDLHKKRLVLAISCGVDSSVLLNILEKFKDEYEYEIILAHVNHKRRIESDIEEEYIRNYAKNKYKLHVLELEKQEYIPSFQEYARNLRNDFFDNVMKEEKADYLVLAHHLNDDIETFFMHLMRSSSMESLIGINPAYKMNDYMIIRPLIKVLKADIYEYAKKNDVKFFEDASNGEDDYTRNRLRHNIVSALFKENKDFGSAFINFKEKMEFVNRFIIGTRDNYIDYYIDVFEDHFSFKQDNFLCIDKYLQEEILFYLLKRYHYSRGFILELMKDISSDKRTFVINYKDISLIKDGNDIRINYYLYESSDTYLEINDFGRYQLNDEYDIVFEKVDNIEKNNVFNIGSLEIIWYNSNMFPFVIRSRRDGDKMKLSSGHKKVKDILIDLQLSKIEKDKALLLLNKDGEIISILNVKKSDIIKNMDEYNLKIELIRRSK